MESRHELSVLLCQYLRQKFPSIYQKVATMLEERNLLPAGCSSIEEALSVRYASFPVDQFYSFIDSLRPNDDYPSIFRRIEPFAPLPVDTHFETMYPVLRTFGHCDAIYCLASDPLSRYLITAADDRTIKLWRIPDLCPVFRFAGHEDVITNVSLHPTSSLLLSSSEDKTIRIWSLEHGRCLSVLGGASESVNYATFSPTGSMIGAACEDGSVRLWSTAGALAGGPPVRVFKVMDGSAFWVAFSPGSEFLAYSCKPSRAVVVALKTLESAELDVHQGPVDVVEFAQMHTTVNGEVGPRLLTVSSEEGAAAIWRIENGSWKMSAVFRHSGQGRRTMKINKFGWDRDQEILVLAKVNGIFVCDGFTGEIVGPLHPPALAFENCQAVVGHPVRREIFLLANNIGAVCLIDVFRMTVVWENKVVDERPFVDAIWSRDGEWLFLTDALGSITVFKAGFVVKVPVSVDMLTSVDLGISDELFYCNRSGQRLVPQPPNLDIRGENVPLNLSQAPALRNAVVELQLIRRMTETDHPTTAVPPDSRVQLPPLHIPFTNEYPVNPHSRPHSLPVVVDPAGVSADVEGFAIKSDNEDWDMSEFSTDGFSDQTGDDDPMYLCSQDVAPGFWPEWATAISCDDRIFIPHIGDDILFVKRGYMKSLSETGASEESSSAFAEFANIEMLTVTTVDPCPGGMEVHAQLSKEGQRGERVSFMWRIPHVIQFIVPAFRYIALRSLTINVGDTVVFEPFVDGKFELRTGEVRAVSDSWRSDPVESIRVCLDTGEQSIAPYDIVRVNGNIVQTRNPSAIISKMIYDFRVELSRLLTSSEDQDNLHCPDPNDSRVLECVSIPSSVAMISERIDHGWYRSFQGIGADVRLILRNARALLDADDPKIAGTMTVCKGLMETLDRICKRASEERQKLMERQGSHT